MLFSKTGPIKNVFKNSRTGQRVSTHFGPWLKRPLDISFTQLRLVLLSHLILKTVSPCDEFQFKNIHYLSFMRICFIFLNESMLNLMIREQSRGYVVQQHGMPAQTDANEMNRWLTLAGLFRSVWVIMWKQIWWMKCLLRFSSQHNSTHLKSVTETVREVTAECNYLLFWLGFWYFLPVTFVTVKYNPFF